MSPSSLPALRPLAAVLSDLAEACGPVGSATVPVRDAVGGVLAEPLALPGPVPDRARALRAGFAVASRDLVGVSPYAPLLVPEPPFVEAGDPLPEGCDAVLPEDGLSRAGPLAEIVAAVGPGENARRAGEDGAAGQVLAGAGAVLRPEAAAAALAAGLRTAVVRRCDGLVVVPREAAGGGLALTGIPGLRLAGETVAASTGDLGRAVASAPGPVVVVVGNAALGSAAAGWRPLARGLALRPGETAQVFLDGARAVVAVPDRLEAAFAVGRALIAPLVAHLTGLAPARGALRGPLTRKLASAVGLTEIALVRRRGDGLEPLGLGTLSLTALAAAEGWLALPPESEGVQEGDVVEAQAL